MSKVGVIVTRPESMSIDGFANVLHLPLFKIVKLPKDCAHQVAVLNSDIVIFTSQYAVSAYITDFGIDDLAAKLCVAVGNNTKKALTQAGIAKVVAPKVFGSEGILAQLSEYSLANQQIALVKGVKGRNFLKEQLQMRGAKIVEIKLYQQQLAAIDHEYAKQIIVSKLTNVIMITCGRSLIYLLHLYKKLAIVDLGLQPIMVISDRIYRQAVRLGFTKIYRATSVARADIIQCIQGIEHEQRAN